MPLPFSLNPLDFLKLMKDKRQMNRDQVIAWLEGVRADARRLSEVWLKISDELEKSKEEDFEDQKEFRRILGQQAIVGSRLQHFYNLATIAAGGRIDEGLWDGFIMRFGRALNQRNITRAEADAFVSGFNSNRSTQSLEFLHLKETQDATLLLQCDLAALDVFIETIKAAPNAFR